MVNSTINNLNAGDFFSLYNNAISYALHAIISSKDYKSGLANFTRDERNLIKSNHESIAEIATNFFIDNGGSDLVDESVVNDLIHKAIKHALKHI